MADTAPPAAPPPPPPSATAEDPADNRLELIAAIILGLAATLAAFAAYQGALADGNSLQGYTESTQSLSDANFFYTQSFQEFVTDQQLFTQFAVLANSADPADAAVAEYIQTELMNPNLQAAVDWWAADPDAATPFVDDPENPYVQESLVAAEELQQASEDGFAEGARQNEVGDQFELAGVVLAITLFFAGIATLLSSRRIAVALLGVATLTLVGGAVVIVGALTA